MENSDIEIYSEDQLYWIRIKDNCISTIEQFEDSLRLQKEIKILAETKIKQLKNN